jgi:hypothetical protein
METIPAAVYLLCFATSVLCAVLLARSYRRSRGKLLFWTALSFVCLAISNLFLFADVVIFPTIDLLLLRHISTLVAIAVLLYALIWETE